MYYLEDRGDGKFFLCRDWKDGDNFPGVRIVLNLWVANDKDEILIRRTLDAINAMENNARGVS